MCEQLFWSRICTLKNYPTVNFTPFQIKHESLFYSSPSQFRICLKEGQVSTFKWNNKITLCTYRSYELSSTLAKDITLPPNLNIPFSNGNWIPNSFHLPLWEPLSMAVCPSSFFFFFFSRIYISTSESSGRRVWRQETMQILTHILLSVFQTRSRKEETVLLWRPHGVRDKV